MRFKLFFIAFLISLPFWWGINLFQKNLENFFFWQEITNNPQLLTAQISQDLELEKLKPIRNWQIPNLEIEAHSAISVLVKSDRSQKILFEKEKGKILPIASLTKLMTAKIVLGNYELFQKIEISEKAVKETENSGNFKVGEIFSIKELLYPLLMESSNDAARALVEVIGEETFLNLMNLEAKSLNLDNTRFVNATGLDPENPKDPINYSTAEDLVKLTINLLKTNPQILEITSLPTFDLFTDDGIFHHKIINTNELLKEFPSIIIGGKTGETPRAGGCLILITKTPKNKGYLINIILGSKDRFGEMKKLINWLNSAYKW